MAATVNTPRSAHPEPSRVHVSSWANSCGPTSDPHDPGLHGPCQDPRPPPNPQHHIPARPVFYVHAPPPPPFHPYEWPMHFSHNPFAGFPGMGYSMAMPQFPPPTPYKEVPAYIMPQPHMQPVDYRRFIHPQAPSAPYQNPYQNPYQTSRVRPHLTGPVRETVNSAVQTEPQQRETVNSEVQTEPQQRETVNSEVQTEPQQRGASCYGEESPLISADSGRGTPCINNSSYLKRPWNASIWSVEFLAPFIPTKEWLLQNSVLAADVVVEESKKKRSSSDTSLSDSWPLSSTPTRKTSPRKEPEIECDMGSRVQAQSVAPSEKGRSASPNDLQSKMILSTPTSEDTNRSSEPEAIQSPNQDILNEQQNKRTCSHLQEKSPRLNPTEEKTCARRLNLQNGADINLEDGAYGNEEDGRFTKEELCVPKADQKTAEVSPSKVDFGVQCNELQEHKCACEEARCSMGQNGKQRFTLSGKNNGKYRQREGPNIKGQTQRKRVFRKYRGQDSNQHEA
ncbi:hypothetical protein PBY51_020942 [Eleginops maclovinus]|uniref:Uncharacterized protein n=2 Tax=Eleginops maclovinus TaxID=56733 RepID=A0AAN7XA32_ELEMC|nr:hypothetical protein PBY51_020942 [Eleginops maclovinus]